MLSHFDIKNGLQLKFFQLKNWIISIVVLGVFWGVWGGLSSASARGVEGSETGNVPILLYHHIQDLPAGASAQLRRWSLTPKKFEAQMDWMVQQGFSTVTMAQLTAHLKHGTPLPSNPIVLSFDDGWKDHYTVVFPVLKKHNFVGTFFITVGSVGHSAFMNWKELGEMSAAGMDIQAHSMTHPHLDQLPYEKAFHEVVESKKTLEKHLNKPVVVFAYPFGGYNANVLKMVKRAGFESAASVSGLNHGFIQAPKAALYTLVRYAVTGDDTLEVLAQELFFYKKKRYWAPAKHKEPLRRGLYVSVVQDPQVLSSRKAITDMIGYAKQAGIKMLFVQIYRSNQAWFPSKVADSAPYEICRKNLGQDPLAFLIKKAHSQGIEVHAWLNLLSLSANKDANFLKKYGTGILTQNLLEKKKIEDYRIDNQYFLEPGDPRVRKGLSEIVKEILRKYSDLDGIQFDYIRYPDSKPHYGYTEINIKRFKEATGLKTIEEDSLRWKDWKRAQVTELLAGLVRTTRLLRPNIQVSATGCMPYSRAYNEAFQDWPSWIEKRLVDFVTLMNYSPDPLEFERWIETAKAKVTDFKKVKMGVGAYKFMGSPQAFAQEMRICEEKVSACVIFHYGSLRGNPTLGSFLIDAKKK